MYSRLAGYEDLNDAARLSADPTSRLIGSKKVWERGVALTSTLHWFETDLLAHEENFVGLARLNRELVAQGEGVGSPYRVVRPKRTARVPKPAIAIWALQQEGDSCTHVKLKSEIPAEIITCIGIRHGLGSSNF